MNSNDFINQNESFHQNEVKLSEYIDRFGYYIVLILLPAQQLTVTMVKRAHDVNAFTKSESYFGKHISHFQRRPVHHRLGASQDC